MKTRLFFLITLISILSCNSTQNVMDSWNGQTKQHLILKWGPPNSVVSDGGTGEIVIYATQRHSQGIPQYGVPPSNYWDNKYFYVNSEGKIYHWLIKKEKVPPTQIDLTIKSRY